MSLWTTPRKLLDDELQQRRDEGCRIPAHLADRIQAIHPTNQAWDEAAIADVYEALMALPADEALLDAEPNELPAIRARRPDGPRDLRWSPTAAELQDRLHGAWLGRAAGCALGKPVEGMGMSRLGEVAVGRPRIKQYLTNRGSWPLTDFIPLADAGDALMVICPSSCRERIAFMEPDDDIHYTLVGLGVLEKHGPDFAWNDVASYWTNHIPFGCICTAETQALYNFWGRSARHHAAGKGVAGPAAAQGNGIAATPAFTRRFRNPYREWIGAQIRSDGWAYACAGKPELAAEFAWRDASWTHERNGIYGEMLFAAIQAAAFVERDPVRLIEIGLSEIPHGSRLARLVRETMAWALADQDWERVMDRIERRCAELSGGHDMIGVHTINNAAVCVLALLHGGRSPAIGIPLSVMAGLDTDCNGATVGSILGAGAGASGFDWLPVHRLNDTIRAGMAGFHAISMTALAERHAAVWRTVDDYHRGRAPQG